MPGTDRDATQGYSPDSDATRAAAMQEVPWSAIALSGMGLIAISLVAFVMVTDESAPPRGFTQIESGVGRISVSERAPSSAAASRRDDATSTIPRTIRMSPPTLRESAAPLARRTVDEGAETVVARASLDMRASLAPAPDPRLIAPGPYGALPRIGRDGARPSEVYARPPATRVAPGAPRVAIVVTGLGPDAAGGEHAIETLPGAVTFAFSPYGENLEEQADHARAAGHELLLQTPMEGAADDRYAGPRTLAADAPRERTLDSLHWHMSRFSGYVGLVNHLGARFMAAPQSYSTLLQDLAERGLVFLDDGAAPQSLTPALAAAAGAQAARADVSIDKWAPPEVVDAALRRLETLARERGSAIAVATLRTQSVDRIRTFAQGLEARGVALVPVSALIEAQARTSAR